MKYVAELRHKETTDLKQESILWTDAYQWLKRICLPIIVKTSGSDLSSFKWWSEWFLRINVIQKWAKTKYIILAKAVQHSYDVLHHCWTIYCKILWFLLLYLSRTELYFWHLWWYRKNHIIQMCNFHENCILNLHSLIQKQYVYFCHTTKVRSLFQRKTSIWVSHS